MNGSGKSYRRDLVDQIAGDGYGEEEKEEAVEGESAFVCYGGLGVCGLGFEMKLKLKIKVKATHPTG